jgi:hypothetical protein
MDVYGNIYNLDSILHVSYNIFPHEIVTIAPSGLSHVTCQEQEQQGRKIRQE